MRGEILDFHGGQDQETIVGDQIPQVGSASRLRPSYVFVSLLQRPRCRTEGQRPKIAMSLALHHVPDLGATQMPAPKIVVPIKKREPDLGFLRVSAGDGIHGNFPDLTERTRELSNVS